MRREEQKKLISLFQVSHQIYDVWLPRTETEKATLQPPPTTTKMRQLSHCRGELTVSNNNNKIISSS